MERAFAARNRSDNLHSKGCIGIAIKDSDGQASPLFGAIGTHVKDFSFASGVCGITFAAGASIDALALKALQEVETRVYQRLEDGRDLRVHVATAFQRLDPSQRLDRRMQQRGRRKRIEGRIEERRDVMRDVVRALSRTLRLP